MRFLSSQRLHVALDVAVFGGALLVALATLTVPSSVAYAFLIAMPVAAVGSRAMLVRYQLDGIGASDLSLRSFALALGLSIFLAVTLDLVASGLGVEARVSAPSGYAALLLLTFGGGFYIGLNVAILLEARRRRRTTRSV